MRAGAGTLRTSARKGNNAYVERRVEGEGRVEGGAAGSLGGTRCSARVQLSQTRLVCCSGCEGVCGMSERKCAVRLGVCTCVVLKRASVREERKEGSQAGFSSATRSSPRARLRFAESSLASARLRHDASTWPPLHASHLRFQGRSSMYAISFSLQSMLLTSEVTLPPFASRGCDW